jgi:hypothetical protein
MQIQHMCLEHVLQFWVIGTWNYITIIQWTHDKNAIPIYINNVCVTYTITITTSLRKEPLEPTWPPRNLSMIIIESLVLPKYPNMKGLNYFKYVKWTNLDAHVHVFKVVIQANSEIEGANIVNFLNSHLET